MRLFSKSGLAALVSAAVIALASPASAATIMLDVTGTIEGQSYSGDFSLNVVNGQATSGAGFLSIFGLTNAPVVLITTSTPGNETAGGPSAPVGFRDNFGTDLFGADQSYPLTAAGLLFNVGTTTAAFGQFPLFNLYSNNDGSFNSLFTGTVNGTEHYAVTGSANVSSTVGGVPEPSTWAMMLVGFAGLAYATSRKQTSGRANFTAA